MDINYYKGFERVLKDGIKIHTIRRRFYADNLILKHIVYPYTRGKRRCVLESCCSGHQTIEIYPLPKQVLIDHKPLSSAQIDTLAYNDGFESTEDFWKSFKEDFQGYITHWTGFRY